MDYGHIEVSMRGFSKPSVFNYFFKNKALANHLKIKKIEKKNIFEVLLECW